MKHWIDGGETRLSNLVLLCSAHHRLLHHGAFHITVEDDGFAFVSRDGEVIEPALRPQFPAASAGVSEGVSEGTRLPGPGTHMGCSLGGLTGIRDSHESSYHRRANPDNSVCGLAAV